MADYSNCCKIIAFFLFVIKSHLQYINFRTFTSLDDILTDLYSSGLKLNIFSET